MLFGKIVENEMELNRRGEIVKEEWFASANIRNEIRLFPDEFVVMPNHLHGIVWIVGAAGRPYKMNAHMGLRQNLWDLSSRDTNHLSQNGCVTNYMKPASGSAIITTASSVTNGNWTPFGNTSKQIRAIGRRMMRISF
jgi:hypothetical protein